MQSPQAVLADLASMLLSNISFSPVTCTALTSVTIQVVPEPKLASQCFPVQSRCGSCPAPVPYPSNEALDVPALPLLIDAFVQGAQIEEDLSKRVRKGKLHFLASVFANLSGVRSHQISCNSNPLKYLPVDYRPGIFLHSSTRQFSPTRHISPRVPPSKNNSIHRT